MKNFYLTLYFIIISILLSSCNAKPQLNQYIPKEHTITVYKDRILPTQKTKNNDLQISLKQFNFKKSNDIKENSFALIIGINNYKQNTNVNNADISALCFSKLAHTTFGIPKENIITLINFEATSGQVKAKIELIKELTEKDGNIYFFFAGHGVPAKNGFTYLLPSDMSAHSIEFEPSLKFDTIYKKLSNSEAKNVFIFIDSCFSGKDDNGDLLYRGVAPVLKTNKTILPNKNITIFTAGQARDFANNYEDKKQRLFSYSLIKELSSGNTNLNKTYTKVRKEVKRISLKKGIGYKQIPQIYGNTNVALH